MRNVSDIIEEHLKRILLQSNGAVEIQRNELADKFRCVPSQINYVISTRFTVEKGYLVESKRGGGGYIRIRKVGILDKENFYHKIMDNIGECISSIACENIIERMMEEGLINQREMRLMRAATGRILTNIPVTSRDFYRAEILKTMLTALFIF